MNFKDKEVLVTGAGGFIGYNLTKRLIDLGADVTAIDNFMIGVKREFPIIDCDTRDFMTDTLDFIFHLGAPCSVIQFNKNPKKSMDNTLHGFYNILDVAGYTGAKLVYPSSGNIYGSISSPQSEDMIPKPLNMYAISKLTCERMASLARNVDSTGLRIFAGYGKGEEHKRNLSCVITLFLNDMLKDKQPIIWGDGTQTRDFIYIDDIVEALLRASWIDCPIVNVGTGKSYSFNQVIDLINKYLDKDIKPKYIHKPSSYVDKTRADTRLMHKKLGLFPPFLEIRLKDYVNYLT